MNPIAECVDQVQIVPAGELPVLARIVDTQEEILAQRPRARVGVAAPRAFGLGERFGGRDAPDLAAATVVAHALIDQDQRTEEQSVMRRGDGDKLV